MTEMTEQLSTQEATRHVSWRGRPRRAGLSLDICLAICAAVLLASILLAKPTLAEVYKRVDKNGNVTYSDQPAKGAKSVDVKPANSIPAVEVPPRPAADATADAENTTRKSRRVEIAEPADDSAIEHGPGNFSVTVTLKPALQDGHKLQLLVDGKPFGEAGTNTSFQLTNVDRGTHELQAKVLSEKGKTLKTSKASKVHVFRPSVAHPGNRR